LKHTGTLETLLVASDPRLLGPAGASSFEVYSWAEKQPSVS